MEEVTVWLARNEDNSLYVYSDPNISKDYEDGNWLYSGHVECLSLDSELFPQVKWEDSVPTKAKLVLSDKDANIWLFRDKDNSLWAYSDFSSSFAKVDSVGQWSFDKDLDFMELSSNLFPEVRWEDTEPTKARLVLWHGWQ